MEIHRKEFGSFQLSSGRTIRGAFLEIASYGNLNHEKDNVVLMPTPYSAVAEANEIFFGTGRPIDPEKHFILVPNLLGNGRSSSPSNQATIAERAEFPVPTFYDNVKMQQAALTDFWGIERISLVAGFSMGGCQSLQWGVQYPDQVSSILAGACTARTSPHNFAFLEGVKAALTADTTYKNGYYEAPPLAGLEALGRAWCSWAYSQAWFRREGFKELGFDTVSELLDDWGRGQLDNDANNLLCMLHTWQRGDVSDNELYRGNLAAALGAIKARTIMLPSSTDMYFRVKDCEADAKLIGNCELRVHQTDWGHACRAERTSPRFVDAFDRAAADLLEGSTQ